jgi:hypothetical protein
MERIKIKSWSAQEHRLKYYITPPHLVMRREATLDGTPPLEL